MFRTVRSSVSLLKNLNQLQSWDQIPRGPVIENDDSPFVRATDVAPFLLPNEHVGELRSRQLSFDVDDDVQHIAVPQNTPFSTPQASTNDLRLTRSDFEVEDPELTALATQRELFASDDDGDGDLSSSIRRSAQSAPLEIAAQASVSTLNMFAGFFTASNSSATTRASSDAGSSLTASSVPEQVGKRKMDDRMDEDDISEDASDEGQAFVKRRYRG